MTIEGITVINHQPLHTPISKTLSPAITGDFDAFFLQSLIEPTAVERLFNTPTPLAISPRLQSTTDTSEMPIASPAATKPDIVNVTDQFVQTLLPYAKKAAQLIGLDPTLLVAQAMLETSLGQFIAQDINGNTSNNLFNIKANAENAESVTVKTTEFIHDIPMKTTASFKQYASMEQSLHDYIALIKDDPRYKTALLNTNDPERYVNALQTAGYATDPNYAKKILSIYHSDKLQQIIHPQSDMPGLIFQ